MKTKILGLLAVGLLAAPVGGHAAMLNFYLSDGANEISFQLDSSPVPDYSGPPLFGLNDINVTVNGVTSLYSINFFYGVSGGGLSIVSGDGWLIDQTGSGEQLFTGYTGWPRSPVVFLPGNFILSDGDPEDDIVPRYAGPFDLQISAANAPVPLPAAAWLLLSGLGGLGLVARRKAA